MQSRLLTPENDYGELETGNTTLAFVSLDLAKTNLDKAGGYITPSETHPCPASITLVTTDVEAALAQATKAGGQLYVEPLEKPWGQTVAYLLGPSNLLIEVATPVSN